MTSINEIDINFRMLAYEVNVGIFVCDISGVFIYANLALAEIFGVEHPREIVGKHFKDFLTPQRARNFMGRLRETMNSGTKGKPIWTDLARQNASAAYIEVNAMPFVKDRILVGSQGVVIDITKFRQAVEKVMHTSTHDPLTGIYNRTFFEAEMNRLTRGRQFPISIIVVAVKGLENFQGSEAQQRKEKICIRIARQLFYTFRGDDIIARIGEDEFAAIFPLVDEQTASKIVRRTQIELHTINNDENISGLEFFIGASTANSDGNLVEAFTKALAVVELRKKSTIK